MLQAASARSPSMPGSRRPEEGTTPSLVRPSRLANLTVLPWRIPGLFAGRTETNSVR
jgi:hypothetical protein